MRIEAEDGTSLNDSGCVGSFRKGGNLRMKSLSLMTLSALLFAAVYVFADAQITAADIPFSFIAEGKTYPAGSYRFVINDADRTMRIEGIKSSKDSGIVPVLTRLAARPGSLSSVVFDAVGNDHYLSEIYLPDMDGYYFKSAPTKHTHTTIKASKN
jgi:hypothetical protein